MRTLLVILFVAGAFAGSPNYFRRFPGTRSTANINEYLDQVLPLITEFAVDKGLDPIALPDDEQTFSEEGPLGIVWHGEVGLFDGSLSGLSHVARAGDAFLNYNDLSFDVNMTLGFPDVALFYGFECRLMDIGPKGSIEGTVSELEVFAEIILHMEDLANATLSLQQLYFSNAGRIDLKIEGIGLDLIDNLLADIVTTLFHDTIINAIEDQARSVIQEALDNVDIGALLPSLSKLAIKSQSH